MRSLKFLLRIFLASVFIVSSPCMAGTSELDNDKQIANTRQQIMGLPGAVIVRENKSDGSVSVAVDKGGACSSVSCEATKIKTMEFQNVVAGELYSMDGVSATLATDELDGDYNAGRESWFWAVLFVGAVIGVAWHNSKHSHHKNYYSYNPYWEYQYNNYSYWAYGCGRCGYRRGYNPYYRY